MSSDLEIAESIDDVEPVAAKQSNTGGRPKSFVRDYFASDTTAGQQLAPSANKFSNRRAVIG